MEIRERLLTKLPSRPVASGYVLSYTFVSCAFKLTTHSAHSNTYSHAVNHQATHWYTLMHSLALPCRTMAPAMPLMDGISSGSSRAGSACSAGLFFRRPSRLLRRMAGSGMTLGQREKTGGQQQSEM